MPAPDGPPAEVYVYVLPASSGGRYSLFCYPRRRNDTRIFFTTPGHPRTPSKARELMWVPSGLQMGQSLTIHEKGTSDSKGHFHGLPFTLHSGQPFKLSGPPVKGPTGAKEATWSYEIILSDGSGILARLDPDVIIIEDP